LLAQFIDSAVGSTCSHEGAAFDYVEYAGHGQRQESCRGGMRYPQGKSAGMRRAVAADDETLQTFPAVGLRGVATWIMDKAAASKLGDKYNV
jgi:hypothetical protein